MNVAFAMRVPQEKVHIKWLIDFRPIMVKNENYLIVVVVVFGVLFRVTLRLEIQKKTHGVSIHFISSFTCSPIPYIHLFTIGWLEKTRISHDVFQCEQTNTNGRGKPTKMQTRTQRNATWLNAHEHYKFSTIKTRYA